MHYDQFDEFDDYPGTYVDPYDNEGEDVVYIVMTPGPDPILIAGVTILVGIFLITFLTRITGIFFRLPEQSQPVAATITDPLGASQSGIQEDTGAGQANLVNGDCLVSSRFPTKVTRWCNLITQYAAKHQLDPDLIAALVWLESGGNELAYSHSGAVGLMQVMPRDGLAASFMCANGPCFRDRPSTDELKDPEFNIAYGTRFLASLVKRKGDLREALKSYGPMDAGYSYSDKVLSIFKRYKSD